MRASTTDIVLDNRMNLHAHLPPGALQDATAALSSGNISEGAAAFYYLGRVVHLGGRGIFLLRKILFFMSLKIDLKMSV